MLTIFTVFFNFDVKTCFKTKSVINLIFCAMLLHNKLLHNFNM